MADPRSPVAIFTLLLAAMLFQGGCASPSTAPDAPAPEQLSLRLRTRTATGRYTYFDLSDKGVLSFGGGQAATQSLATPVATLTPQQREKVWQIIKDYDLPHARSRPFSRAQTVSYELDLHTGGLGHSLRVVDDQIAGLKELHDYLFDLQAQVRYKLPGLPTGSGAKS